jgi:hypothetical protein
LLFGITGAVMNYNDRLATRSNFSLKRRIATFFIDLFSSMGIAVMVFLGSVGLGFNELVSVALSGFMSYQGTRGIYLIELVIFDKLGSKELIEEVNEKHKK